MANEKSKYQTLELVTILSSRTKEGMVDLRLDGKTITQWDVRKAKEVHQMLGEAIEAAVSDTIIYKFFTEEFGLDNEHTNTILLKFRELRQGSRNTVFPI